MVSPEAGAVAVALGEIAPHTAARSQRPVRSGCLRRHAHRCKRIQQRCAGPHPGRFNIAAMGRHLDMQIRKPCNYGCVDRKRTIFPA